MRLYTMRQRVVAFSHHFSPFSFLVPPIVLPLLRTPCLHRASEAVLRVAHPLSQSLSLGDFLEPAVVAPCVGTGRAVLCFYTDRTFPVLALYISISFGLTHTGQQVSNAHTAR